VATVKPAPRERIGVATTTPVAFVAQGKLCLERMNVLAADGAGILAQDLPALGSRLELVFRLSTAREAVRCQAEVMSHLPTTPAGLALRTRRGESAFKAAMGATLDESATMLFRMGDLAQAARRRELTPKAVTGAALSGFCVRFVGLDQAARERLSHHLEVARELGQKLMSRGDRLLAIGTDEQATMAAMFDDGDLAAKAKDW